MGLWVSGLKGQRFQGFRVSGFRVQGWLRPTLAKPFLCWCCLCVVLFVCCVVGCLVFGVWCLCVLVLVLVLVLVWLLVLDPPGPPCAGPPALDHAGPANISRFFFSSPAPMFALFVSLWVSSRGILVVFEASEPSNVRVWSSRFRVKPRRPRSRSHPSGPHPSGPHFSGFGPHPLESHHDTPDAKIGQIRMAKTGLAKVGLSSGFRVQGTGFRA